MLDKLFPELDKIKDEPTRKAMAEALKKAVKGDMSGLTDLARFKHGIPMGFREFIESKDGMDAPDSLYPVVMEEMEELNSGKYVEAVLTGGIGVGKTHGAVATTAYQLYLLSCLVDPHKEFDLDPTSEIVFIFQSVNERTAKAVDFARFKAMIDLAPYFRDKFRYNREVESELQFPNRIYVKPVSAAGTAVIGQNVFGGVIDEINFLSVVEKSKKSNNGDVYDQAVENYNSISRRRKSRFMQKGQLPGILCLVSSKNYPGDFTERKEAEAKTDPTIFVYDKRVWDIKPESFTGEWFTVFVGDLTRPPRILQEDEDGNYPVIHEDEAHLYMDIPIEFLHEFENDMMSSLRDIAGVATMALHPYFRNNEILHAACNRISILSRTKADFRDTLIEIVADRFQHSSAKRWVHLDLALTGDSAGVAMGYVDKFVKVHRGDEFEILPNINFDFTLEVTPPMGDEIQLWKIRELLYIMRDTLGIPIEWVSMDTFQSADMIQTLRTKMFRAGVVSVDKTTGPYDILKRAFYDNRVSMPRNDKLMVELAQLEYDTKSKKIDHPARGSKDIADALAGVAFGLTTRVDIWLEHDITPHEIPDSVLAVSGQNEHVNAVADQRGGEP